jgi:hypothetical protein
MKEFVKLKYDIPLPFKLSTNKIYSWMDWRKRSNIADRYHRLTKDDCNKLTKFDNKVSIDFQFYFKTRCFDSSNCSFIWKMIEDSLVKNKLITDDSNRYIWKVSYESIRLEWKERKEVQCDYVKIHIYEI